MLLFSFHLTIPKIFYIVSDIKLEGRTPVKKNLPPGIHANYIYQVEHWLLILVFVRQLKSSLLNPLIAVQEVCTAQEYGKVLKQLSVELAPIGASVHEVRVLVLPVRFICISCLRTSCHEC